MRVAVVQFAPALHATTPNWDRMREWARNVPADVIVLPELASCGYMYQNRLEAEPYADSRDALAPFQKIARSTGRLIIGGFAERANGLLYDSAFAASPDRTTVYRKIHLWNRETVIFEAGQKPRFVEFQGHRIGLEICYDIQFPEFAAYLSRHGAEMLVVPTAWAEEVQGPLHGLQPYSHLAIATAFANGVFVAVANRTGTERGARFPGESSVTNPFGQMQCLEDKEGVLVQDVDFSQTKGAKRPTAFNDLDRDRRLRISLPGPARHKSPGAKHRKRVP